MLVRAAPARRLVAIACVLVAGVWATASAVSPASAAPARHGGQNKAAGRVTFGIAPATPGHADNRTEFGYRLAPATRYDDHVALDNFSAKPLTLRISAVDLSNDASGAIEAGTDHAAARDAGRWVRLRHRSTVVVPPQTRRGPGQVIIPFTVSVPAKVTPGDHAAEILGTLTTTSRHHNTNIQLNQRIGVRMFIRVPGDLRPAVAVRDLSVSYRNNWGNPVGSGRAVVHYRIVNTGNVVLDTKQAASIDGWFGTGLAVPAGDTPEIRQLLPGRSASISFVLDGVWPSIARDFHVTVTPAFTTASTPLDQSSGVGRTRLAAVTASSSFFAVPWVLIAVVIVLLLIAAAWWWRRRTRRRSGAPRPGGEAGTKQLQPTGRP
jgi:hypothetical protein